MEDYELDEMDREIEEITRRMAKVEEEGAKNILKYFDRIHDKVFKFNNILIAGYYFIAKFEDEISFYLILVPLLNLVFIIWIEYRMMEKSRFESEIMKKPKSERDQYGSAINKTNLYSLLVIVTTVIVTLILLVNLFIASSNLKSESVNPSIEEYKEEIVPVDKALDTVLQEVKSFDTLEDTLDLTMDTTRAN